jgi:hypothetical protein
LLEEDKPEGLRSMWRKTKEKDLISLLILVYQGFLIWLWDKKSQGMLT